MLTICLSMIADGGDKINFEKFYNKYSSSVLKRIYAILGNSEDSEDVAQETWIKVAKNIELFRGKEDRTVLAYIMRVAKNEAISKMRVISREKEILCGIDVNEIDIADDTAFFEMCARHDGEAISECIRSLDEIYSTVLVYYYLYHYNVREISELFSLKEITVYKRIERGRSKLIKLLERRGYK